MKNYNTHVPCPTHYLSIPSVGGMWKNNVNNDVIEVVGSNPVHVLFRYVYGPAEQIPEKINSLEEFYASFSFVGPVQNAANTASQ